MGDAWSGTSSIRFGVPKGTWTLMDSGKTGLFASCLAYLGLFLVILRSFQSRSVPKFLHAVA